MKTEEMEIVQSPMYEIALHLAKNNKDLTPALQNAIARFISIESTPIIRYEQPETLALPVRTVDREAVDRVSFQNLMQLLKTRLGHRLPNKLASELLHWRNSYVNELTEGE